MQVIGIFIAALFALLTLAPPAAARSAVEVSAKTAIDTAGQPADEVAGQATAGVTDESAGDGAAQAQLADRPVADGSDKGTIFTLWPLIDYRDSPADGFSNLSILGPLIKFQKKGGERDTAVRPFFYQSSHGNGRYSSTYFLYPAAFLESTPESDTYQVVRLFQKSNFRKDDESAREGTAMLFPFYIAGHSEKRGSYWSLFPFYGNIYDRFWRDEYHFLMFPLYGSTVKRGTTTSHYLYPVFSLTKGENESGFGVFPLYGQSEKTGVYSRKFALWPFYTWEKSGLDTDNPTEKKLFFPIYASTDSPKRTSRSYLWPFFGYTDDREKKIKEVDYFWPFISTKRGENRNANTFLPFYSRETFYDGEKRWFLWPFFRHEEIRSEHFNRDSDRVLFFLYRSSLESWPKDGTQRRRTALWPLFLYQTTPRGVSSLSLPAPVESILDKEGIEKNWAPLWRLYQRRWDQDGNSASTFLWNLYWHERRGQELACELFPLVSYRGLKLESELKLLKGLISLKSHGEARELSLLWLPFGLKWGGK